MSRTIGQWDEQARLSRSGAAPTRRFGHEAKGAVVRPKAILAAEFEIHANLCTGPLLAGVPLAPAVRRVGQNELRSTASTSQLNDSHDLCIFAFGDPRDGRCVLARMAISK